MPLDKMLPNTSRSRNCQIFGINKGAQGGSGADLTSHIDHDHYHKNDITIISPSLSRQ